MSCSKTTVGAMLWLLSFGAVALPAVAEPPPVHVDLAATCRQGLIVWLRVGRGPRCGQFQTPQVKVFDAAGRLRFAGTGVDALAWVGAGMPVAPIPAGVRVRDAATEARLTHVAAPLPGHGWAVFYTTRPCPPCEQQLATWRSDVMPKLGARTDVSVFDVY